MCGIAVTWNNEYRCRRMLQYMAHRGLPGLEYSQVVDVDSKGPFFGHVRLPIIDTTVKQNQPITNGKITMVFNGEIYNYKDLDSNANSDTEVLLDILSNYGPEHLTFVDGMYAIVYYDHRDGSTHVITDHLCKKPLYINLKTRDIASEIKALDPSNELNKKFFATVSHLGYYPGYETAFTDVIQVPPNAHLVIYSDQRFEWYIDFLNMKPTDVCLEDTIVKAVKNRLVSDVPISFLLSGGLDSTLIVELVKQITPLTLLSTFTIENNQDTEYADLVAKDVNSYHNHLSINKADRDYQILYMNESPVDLGSVVPQYQLCEAVAQQGFRVVITGDGADELFGGYTRMSKHIAQVADTQYHDIFVELPYYHCTRLDKMSMAHTLELRSPFLSRDVIRAAMAIPYENRIGKKVLKDTFSAIIPLEIRERKKEPLRIEEMRLNKEEFRFKRLQQFMNIIEKGGYTWKNNPLNPFREPLMY